MHIPNTVYKEACASEPVFWLLRVIGLKRQMIVHMQLCTIGNGINEFTIKYHDIVYIPLISSSSTLPHLACTSVNISDRAN